MVGAVMVSPHIHFKLIHQGSFADGAYIGEQGEVIRLAVSFIIVGIKGLRINRLTAKAAAKMLRMPFFIEGGDQVFEDRLAAAGANGGHIFLITFRMPMTVESLDAFVKYELFTTGADRN